MKKILGFFIVLIIAGCATYGPDDVKNLVTDPHYTEYQSNMDSLESSYLKGEMKYPEYLNRKQHIEDEYNKKAKQQENIIVSP